MNWLVLRLLSLVQVCGCDLGWLFLFGVGCVRGA